MDDLEINRRCAEAMGFWVVEKAGEDPADWGAYHPRCKPHIQFAQYPNDVYAPLVDDAQAFELIERLELNIGPDVQKVDGVWTDGWEVSDRTGEEQTVFNPDLNRAVCLCVAKLQAKEG